MKEKKHIDKDRQNVIKIKDSDFNLDFVDINDDFLKKPKICPFDDVCSICSSKIYFNKFVCVVCKNCVLCKNCEKEHLHPVLKCKQSQLSTLEDIYKFLTKNNKEIYNMKVDENNKNNNNMVGLFSNLIYANELKLDCNSLNFSMRPNKKILIPISVHNLSNKEFDCEKNKIILYAKNNKDLRVHEKLINQKINGLEQIDVNMLLESNEFCKIYYFTIELYSAEKINLKYNILSFKLEVNNDEEDEKLNEEFKNFPKIIVMPKNIKKGVKVIMKDKSVKQDPITIMQFLKNNNGNVEKTIIALKTMDENKNKNIF